MDIVCVCVCVLSTHMKASQKVNSVLISSEVIMAYINNMNGFSFFRFGSF